MNFLSGEREREESPRYIILRGVYKYLEVLVECIIYPILG